MERIDREVKRNRKIARTLIRLRHSLNADREIEDYLDQERDALTSGVMPGLEVNLKDITGS